MVIKATNLVDTNWTNNPFVKIAALMRFIQNRRIDSSSSIIRWNELIKYFAIFAILLAILLLFADQPFLDALRANTVHQSELYRISTKLADSKWALIFSGICVLLMGYITGDKFSGKLHAVWHRAFFSAWFVFYSVGMSGILVIVLKYAFGRSRPRFVSGDYALEFNLLTGGYDFASFPSGHSTTAGAVMMSMVMLFPRFKFPIILLSILIASTRPLVGAHFPSDVLAGLAFGAVFTWIYARSMAQKRLLFKFSDKGNLLLRNEGYGYCHNIPSMILQSIAGKKNISLSGK